MRKLILLLCISILTGTLVYLSLRLFGEKEQAQEKITVNEAPQNNITGIRKTAGPFGMLAIENSLSPSYEEKQDQETFLPDYKDNRKAVWSKGIYVTAQGAQKQIDSFISLLKSTELNTVVIDIKDDQGNITYAMDYQHAKDIKAVKTYITDIDTTLQKLKENNIYVIARIVTFKDPVLAKGRPELALKKKDGTVFKDKDGQAWVNPYKKLVWDYVLGVAKKCAEKGFNEINFDYIRFSTDKGMSQVDYGEEAVGKTKIEAVTEFVKYACEQLRPMGVFVSADVYGAIIKSEVDAKIVGQSYVEMARYLDYICPMIYPSHYGNNYYGIDYPDTQPYELIMGALKDSKDVLSVIGENEHCADVRPWLQDFTASWLSHYITYNKEEVREQIEAVYDSNYHGWLLWNGGMKYTKDALYTEEEADRKYANRPVITEQPTEQPAAAPKDTEASLRLSPEARKFVNMPWKR